MRGDIRFLMLSSHAILDAAFYYRYINNIISGRTADMLRFHAFHTLRFLQLYATHAELLLPGHLRCSHLPLYFLLLVGPMKDACAIKCTPPLDAISPLFTLIVLQKCLQRE